MIQIVDGEKSETERGLDLRASGYNIYVDLPGDSSSMLIVHGYTGAFDKISRRLGAYIRSKEVVPVPKPLYGQWEAEESTVEPVAPDPQLVETLTKRGYLTSKSVAAEEAFFVRRVGLIRERQRRLMPTYIVMPSYDCNLRCHYCFQDFMRTDSSYSHLLQTMSDDIVDRIVTSLPFIESEFHGFEKSHNYKRSITFFGGEPLLRATRRPVERFMKKSEDIGECSFSAVTNATEIHHYADLLGPQGLESLQITLDGPAREHDRRRIYADGSGSFDAIDRNIDLALEKGSTVVIRVNVDRSSIGGLPEMTAHFDARGWTSHRGFSCYVSPVTDALGSGTRSEFYNTYELGEAIKDLQRTFPQMKAITPVDYKMMKAARDMFVGGHKKLPTSTTFCGAHDGMYVFDPFADIYACWEKTGNKSISIGSVLSDSSVELNGLAPMWRNRDVTSNPTCRRCRFALHCGGGCAVLAESSSGTLYSNFCDAFGKRLRGRLAEAFVEHLNGESGGVKTAMAAAIEAFVD